MNIKAKIKNKEEVWEEVFDVSSKETAEQEIKDTVEFYNETLKPGDKKREFVELVKKSKKL